MSTRLARYALNIIIIIIITATTIVPSRALFSFPISTSACAHTELRPPRVDVALLPRRKRSLGANRVSATSLSRKLAEFCAPDTVTPFLRLQVAVASAAVTVVGDAPRVAGSAATARAVLTATADAFALELLRCVDGALGVGVSLGAIIVTEGSAAPPRTPLSVAGNTADVAEPATLLRLVPSSVSDAAVQVHVLKGALALFLLASICFCYLCSVFLY